MELVIYDLYSEDRGFIQYILDVIKSRLLEKSLDYTRYQNIFQVYQQDILVESVIVEAAQNLIVQKYNTQIIISINPSVLYNNSIRLIDLCKLLNYGTIEFSGCYIFTKTFDYVASHLDNLYLEYKQRN